MNSKDLHPWFLVSLESIVMTPPGVVPIPTWATALKCREVIAVLGTYGRLARKEPCFVSCCSKATAETGFGIEGIIKDQPLREGEKRSCPGWRGKSDMQA